MATENLLDELGGKGFYAKAAGLAQKAVKDQNGDVIDTTYATKAELPTVDQTYNASSTNAQSGVAVAAAIAGTGQVPSVQQSDDGKVLKAIWDTSVTPPAGSFRWDAAPSGVPSTTSSDEGKVLGVTNSTGSLGWVEQTPAQVNADWNAASGSVAEILNKPSIPTVNDSTVTVKIGSTTVDTFTTNQSSASDIVIPEATESVAGAMTSTDKRKLNGIESGAQVNVKPDWNAASGADAEILNKPAIPSAANDSTVTVDMAGTQSGTNRSVGSFTVDQASASTLSIPAAVSGTKSGGTYTTHAQPGVMSYSDKEKLDDIEAGAEKNVITSIKVDNTTLTPSSGTVTIPLAQASVEGGQAGVTGVIEPIDKKVIDAALNTGWVYSITHDNDSVEFGWGDTLDLVDGTGISSTVEYTGVDDTPTLTINNTAPVPAVTSSDNGKVLKATYSGGAGSYSWQPESGGGGGGSYTAGAGIDISANNEISAKTDGSTIGTNANGQLEIANGAEENVIEGVKLAGAASALTPDASKEVTIPNAVATGETGATNGLMTADDKKALGTAIQYKVNPLESGTPVLLAQQMYVVESDAQIISIAGQSSEIQGKGTIFFRVGV